MPLVIVLARKKDSEQVIATGSRKQEHVKVQDVVLIHPHAESGKGAILHQEGDPCQPLPRTIPKCVFDLDHQGRQVDMKTAF